MSKGCLIDSFAKERVLERKFSPEIDRYHSDLGNRFVQIILPKEAGTDPARRFPVLYLLDGEEAVNRDTWNFLAILQRLRSEVEPLIVVALHGRGRGPEASQQRVADMGFPLKNATRRALWERALQVDNFRIPDTGEESVEYYFRLRSEPRGDALAHFVLFVLKPWIDTIAPSDPAPGMTALGGVSMAALFALNLALSSGLVGRAFAVSPSCWWDDEALLGLVTTKDWTSSSRARLYLGYGSKEGHLRLNGRDVATEPVIRLHAALIEAGWRDGVDVRLGNEPGKHQWQCFGPRTEAGLLFLFPRADQR
mmetsp:Transcript_26811/g.61784  ORF Transcript_26811/g.61784 Transcript_26811/m.61784 type:complete len:309 (-) Transcript_26811:145-1071(-)